MGQSYFLGYCDDTRALLAHLRAEAPGRLASVRVLDRDPVLARTLRANGIIAAAVDLWDETALRAEGLEDATTVVVFAERVGGELHRFERVIRAVCPGAELMVVPTGAGAPPRLAAASSSVPLHILWSWRFWTLVGIAIVDGVVFMVPVTPLLLLAGALLYPRGLRTAARFFDDLADAR